MHRPFYMEEIEMAENKWICPACGQENEGKFCVGCGAAAPAPAADTAAPAAEEVTEAVAAAVPVAAEAAEAAPAADTAEAAPAVEETITVPAEPAYDTTPVEQITEPVAEPVAAEAVTPAYAPVEPAKVDPDEFVPAEPDHSAPAQAAAQPHYSDPDNFVPAPMYPEKQQNNYSGAAAASAPKPEGYTQSVIALIFAIVAASDIFVDWIPVVGWFTTFFGVAFSVTGLVLALVAKGKGFNGGIRTAAFIISLISLIVNILFVVGCIACYALGYYYY